MEEVSKILSELSMASSPEEQLQTLQEIGPVLSTPQVVLALPVFNSRQAVLELLRVLLHHLQLFTFC